MSHFCVLVRVPADVDESDFEEHLSHMLLPYKESGCGSEDPEELKRFLTFHDEEDDYKHKYETESARMVRLPNGEICSRYDERFRNPELFGDPQYILPQDAVEVEIPHKERFETFEQYMHNYCGYKRRDLKKRRYGYWQNPDRKWDWWTIGGRWTGRLHIGYDPAKDRDNYKVCWLCNGTRKDMHTPFCHPSAAGHPVIGKGCNGCGATGWELKYPSDFKPVGNYLRISSLNWQHIEDETKKTLDQFWEQWQEFCTGKEFPVFEGPRNRALSLGLLECKEVKELTGQEWKVVYWNKPYTPEEQKRNRCDVLKPTTKEWLIANCFDAFSPLSSWARLDTNGWQEKGQMGWWGVGSDTPESTQKYASGLREWLAQGDQNDWLVVIDCHI